MSSERKKYAEYLQAINFYINNKINSPLPQYHRNRMELQSKNEINKIGTLVFSSSQLNPEEKQRVQVVLNKHHYNFINDFIEDLPITHLIVNTNRCNKCNVTQKYIYSLSLYI